VDTAAEKFLDFLQDAHRSFCGSAKVELALPVLPPVVV